MLKLKQWNLSQGEVTVAAEEWVELANGCLCCSVKTEFVSALEGLMEKRSRFDYILIETTGAPSPWLIHRGYVLLSNTITDANIVHEGLYNRTYHSSRWPIHGEYSDMPNIPVNCLCQAQHPCQHTPPHWLRKVGHPLSLSSNSWLKFDDQKKWQQFDQDAITYGPTKVQMGRAASG